jgi:hypothetical protein
MLADCPGQDRTKATEMAAGPARRCPAAGKVGFERTVTVSILSCGFSDLVERLGQLQMPGVSSLTFRHPAT